MSMRDREGRNGSRPWVLPEKLPLAQFRHANDAVHIRKKDPPDYLLKERVVALVRSEIVHGPENSCFLETRYLQFEPEQHQSQKPDPSSSDDYGFHGPVQMPHVPGFEKKVACREARNLRTAFLQ
jgi:hypothetical protein